VIRQSTVRLPLAIIVATAAALTSIMTGRTEAALLAAPWAVLAVLGLSSTARHRTRAAVELVADRVLVGDDVELDVTIETDLSGLIEIVASPDPAWWPPGERHTPPRSRVDVIRSGQPLTIRGELPALEWGSHDVGRVEILLREPYGLVQWSGAASEPRRVRVHPTPVQLQRLIEPWMVKRRSGTHESTEANRGIEYADIRPFGTGDGRRDINWRVSARLGGLWVSERHPERATDVVLLFDSFVESGHDVRAVVGLGIEAAVGLAESHLARTDRIGLVELGGIVRWVIPDTGSHQLQRLTDALLSIGLFANAADRDLSIVPPRALPPRSLVVALTPLLDERFIDVLFALQGAGHDVAVIDCLAGKARREENEMTPGDAVSPDGTDSGGRTELSDLAHRMWEAERAVLTDRLAERGVATIGWQRGVPLDQVLGQLNRWRHRARRVSR